MSIARAGIHVTNHSHRDLLLLERRSIAVGYHCPDLSSGGLSYGDRPMFVDHHVVTLYSVLFVVYMASGPIAGDVDMLLSHFHC